MRFLLRYALSVALLFLATLSSAQKTEQLLNRLDEIIEVKDSFRSVRQDKSDSLSSIANSLHGADRVAALKMLYNVYNGFRADSALACIQRIEKEPSFSSDVDLQVFAKISRARTLAMMGLFSESFDILDAIDLSSIGVENRLNFFYTKFTVSGWCAEYASHATEDIAESYRQLMRSTVDSIIVTEKNPELLDMIRATKALNENRPGDVLEICRRLLDNGLVDEQRIFANSLMSMAYQKIGQTELQIHYLAVTAIADIESGVTEYMALPQLAQVLFVNGDIQRAYRYLTCSIEDANFCKARLRTIEASTTFPIIDKAFRASQAAKRKYVVIAMSILAGFMLILVAMIWFLRRQMHKLNYTRQELERAHDCLKAADKKKDEYLAIYLNSCQQCITSIDRYRRYLLALLQSHKMDELLRQLKSDSFANTELEHFYADFDKTFLDLYPHCIEKFNALLKPEARQIPDKEGQLSTVLRIFALIRMGMDDSEAIAHFLNCSLRTVYNYRSRVTKGCISDKDDFIRLVMQI